MDVSQAVTAVISLYFHIYILLKGRKVLAESMKLKTNQSWTLLNDSSLVMSYIRMKPIAPR